MRFPVAAIRPRRAMEGVRKGVVVYKEVLGNYAINSSKITTPGKAVGCCKNAESRTAHGCVQLWDAVRVPQPDLT